MAVLVESQAQTLCTQVIDIQPPVCLKLSDKFSSPAVLTFPAQDEAPVYLRPSKLSRPSDPDSASITKDSSSKASGNKSSHVLVPMESDELPKASALGGLIAGLLKFFVRQLMESAETCVVSIGGENMQLFRGEASSFRIYMKDFCFRGMRVSEGCAHTLEGAGIKFNLGAASWGGKLLSKKVPMILSVRVSQEDATKSLLRNDMLHATMQEFWNHANGHPLSECQVVGPNSKPKFPLELPPMKVTVADGLALFEEVLEGEECQHRQPVQLAIRYDIVMVNGLEELQVTEVDWPTTNSSSPPEAATCPDSSAPLACSQAPRAKWQKIVKFPADIRFQYFALENGCFSYSYKFELDL